MSARVWCVYAFVRVCVCVCVSLTWLSQARKGRPMIQPNFGFVRQLRAWGSANGLPSPPPPAAPEKKAEETATKQAES